uniref:Reverse transcriptase n=1 Tax=Tanacetum cinerariifolium TaxID=118510 RepID=A0A6L2J8X4_TANCI|nr:reverse transcriptase [Tanacetum cinerariifolium]
MTGEYVVGDWVYLKLKPHRQAIIRKAQIHNVFHISQLKKCRGEVVHNGSLPVCNEQGVMMVEPLAILDRRMAKKENIAAVFVLVYWTNGSKEDATWEPIEKIQKNFPSFNV